jgi:predicted nucleic acid-binding protein
LIITNTSVLIPYLAGTSFSERALFEARLASREIAISPMTITEVLSSPKQGEMTYYALDGLHIVELRDGCWGRAGRLRARLLAAGRRAPLGDTLIAQTCLDEDCALLTRDQDFLAFEEIAGLKLDRP